MKFLSTLACSATLLLLAACGSAPSQPASTPTAAAVAVADTQTPAPPAPTATTPAEPTATQASTISSIGTVGETQELIGPDGKPTGLKFTLNSVRRSQGTDLFKPDEGNEYVIVNLTVENTTADKPVPIVPILFYSLRDGADQTYNMALYSDPNGERAPGGTIEPGDTASGDVAFEVPTGATGLVFVFDVGLGAKPVRFNLDS